jgi:hypothetical protein
MAIFRHRRNPEVPQRAVLAQRAWARLQSEAAVSGRAHSQRPSDGVIVFEDNASVLRSGERLILGTRTVTVRPKRGQAVEKDVTRILNMGVRIPVRATFVRDGDDEDAEWTLTQLRAYGTDLPAHMTAAEKLAPTRVYVAATAGEGTLEIVMRSPDFKAVKGEIQPGAEPLDQFYEAVEADDYAGAERAAGLLSAEELLELAEDNDITLGSGMRMSTMRTRVVEGLLGTRAEQAARLRASRRPGTARRAGDPVFGTGIAVPVESAPVYVTPGTPADVRARLQSAMGGQPAPRVAVPAPAPAPVAGPASGRSWKCAIQTVITTSGDEVFVGSACTVMDAPGGVVITTPDGGVYSGGSLSVVPSAGEARYRLAAPVGGVQEIVLNVAPGALAAMAAVRR